MRDDMSKLLVTTPRLGHQMKNEDIRTLRREKISEEGSDLPSRLGMKPRLKSYTERKQLNEYLNPLVRYLEKNCGRPWRKIYSDFKKKNPNGNAVTEHIYEHLFDYVELHPVFKNNEVYDHTGSYKLYRPYGFYVNNAGILLQSKEARPRYNYRKKEDPNIINIEKTSDSATYIIKRDSDGVWFMVEYTPVIFRESFYSPGLAYRTTPGEIDTTGIEFPRVKGMYPNKCRTLSKKEKKKYRLS